GAKGLNLAAADVAYLSRALIDEFPQYYRWYSQREFVWNNIKQGNRNGLLYSDPTADGIKTGFTDHLSECWSAAKSTKASLRIHNKSLQGVIKSSLR
ncbi:hypothetical protein EB061_08255, partial [bacterium]|nr:hypothetical protein [bacterium]